jgi:hypothetical protein
VPDDPRATAGSRTDYLAVLIFLGIGWFVFTRQTNHGPEPLLKSGYEFTSDFEIGFSTDVNTVEPLPVTPHTCPLRLQGF